MNSLSRAAVFKIMLAPVPGFGFGIRDSGFGFRVSGFDRVSVFRFRVSIRFSGFSFRVSGLGFQVSVSNLFFPPLRVSGFDF